MNERKDRRRGTAPMKVALTSLLVASGVGIVGVVPALADNGSPTSAASDSGKDSSLARGVEHGLERGLDRGHDRWFRNRGDVRYVWFRVCDTTATTAATTTTTAAPTTTETVDPAALAAAVDGAAVDTTTTTDTTTTDTTTPTDTTTLDKGLVDAKAYPTFVVVPMSKDEATSVRKLDERPCYDLTTGAPQVAATTTDDTTTETTTPISDTTTTTTTTEAPVDTTTG
jgi:hypothetical protein